MKKSELKNIIKEVLREELLLREATEGLKGTVDEDGIFTSIDGAVTSKLGNVIICKADDGEDIKTLPANKLHAERKEMDNGLTTRFTYLLAQNVPNDFDVMSNKTIKAGLDSLKSVFKEDTYGEGHITYEHKIYSEAGANDTQNIYYSVLLVPDYKNGYQLRSRDYPSLLRGQTEDPKKWAKMAAEVENK